MVSLNQGHHNITINIQTASLYSWIFCPEGINLNLLSIIRHMKIFISGASGLVGGNCYHYFNSKKWDVIGSHHSYPTDYTIAYDTLNPKSKDNFDLKEFNPDYIIHCGALTWVDYCEDHQQESFEKTVQSTINLVNAAKEIGSKLVFIGTDYVFDGKSGPYSETDKVNPLSIYGKHKLEAENIVLNEIPESLVIRITNVYGTELRNKNFIMRLVENAKTGQSQELKLPFDQYATPVNAHDIAKALYLLITDNKKGIYNIASTDYVNRVQLAQRVLSYFPEHQMKITPISTKELNPPAERPLSGGLKSEKFLSEYPSFRFGNVDDFLKQFGS